MKVVITEDNAQVLVAICNDCWSKHEAILSKFFSHFGTYRCGKHTCVCCGRDTIAACETRVNLPEKFIKESKIKTESSTDKPNLTEYAMGYALRCMNCNFNVFMTADAMAEFDQNNPNYLQDFKCPICGKFSLITSGLGQIQLPLALKNFLTITEEK